MKIMHLNQFLDYKGGVESYLLSLLPELEQLGHSQVMLYADGRSELATTAYQVNGLSKPDYRSEREAYGRTKEIIEREKPDLAHIHQLYNIGAIRACLESIPVCFTGHDYRYLCPVSSFYYRRTEEICPRNFGVHCFWNAAAKRCMTPRPGYAYHYYRRVKYMSNQIGRIRHVVAPSEYARSRFIQGGFASEQVTTVPYFCPIEPLAEPRPVPKKATILFLGRIRPNKGYKYFVKALGLLPAEVNGVMIGDFTDKSRSDVRQLAEEAGCGARLDLRNWAGREEIRAAFMQASVFVFTSLWAETLGIVGLEALSCGVPVVATDVGGVREWLRPGQTGLLAKPKDAASLADAIHQILNGADMPAMGRAGIDLVRNKFSKQVHMDQLLGIYARMRNHVS